MRNLTASMVALIMSLVVSFPFASQPVEAGGVLGGSGMYNVEKKKPNTKISKKKKKNNKFYKKGKKKAKKKAKRRLSKGRR